ncbi:2-dehydropantoate 2-reductase [Pseudoroseomonas deserti]|uniref:2-dehydropantoate 2-reductase n=1 Tax=Teichococcus deserti TaxID=1817963 RepID=A0A1V2GTT4_9PROT|nr:2-dehydropantoate 2-reductase [Pseudoroseomonas deserti]ONG43950.1 2-dehydropantoate 2-reductase [Pseudoroseomonas deserti]
MTGQSVAVIGLGGIGGSLAAALQAAGRHAVLCCARRPLDRLILDHPEGREEVSPPVATTPEGLSPVDWVALCTKAQDSAAAAPWLRVLCGPATRVAVLQNGIGHAARLGGVVPPERVVPAIVYFNGERLGDGHLRLRRVTECDMAVPDDEAGRGFAALLAGSLVGAHPAPDFVTRAWRKLLINIVANPLTAITRQRQQVLRRDDIRALGLALLEEAVAVGRAEGAELPGDAARAVWALLMTYPAEAGTSMYQDALAGRPLEIEALTGTVVAAAERHGIPVPQNRAMLALLRAVSDAAG